MGLILDTDHCVEILRHRLDPARQVGADEDLYITATTVAELADGAMRSAHPKRNFETVLQLLDTVTVLPFDTDAALRFGQLKQHLRQQGQLLADPDVQIASTALSHALPLASHNQRHFRRVPGLELRDWMGGG